MSAPKRIHLRRTKGWRKPEGAIVVARPSKWGNPFVVANPMYLDDSLALYRNLVRGVWSPQILNERQWSDAYCGRIYLAHIEWSERMGDHPTSMIRAHLAGRDLACWCPLDQPCHADVLLEIANGGAS